MVASKLLLAIATIGLALPVHAAPAPIVSDFENGLEGWELHGSARLVRTEVLGGQFAIFGDGSVGGGAFISIVTDFTQIASTHSTSSSWVGRCPFSISVLPEIAELFSSPPLNV